MERKTTFIIFSLLFSLSIIWGGATEAVTSLVGRNAEGYLGPVGTILGTDMNSGFYRKATPHKILGFDFTIDMVYAMAPQGQTTYNFYVPDGPGDTISFPFQFTFPKSLLTSETTYLNAIPSASGDPLDPLYQDREIPFALALTDLLEAPTEPAQNILGTSASSELSVTVNKAIPQIFDQVVDHTWEIIQDIGGLGTELTLDLPGSPTIPALYTDKEAFAINYKAPLDSLIGDKLGQIDTPTLPIPGGFGSDFDKLPIPAGIPMPILQASFGLPFHTELTVRGLPVAMPIPSLGSIKFGGFGGKIGISEFFRKKPKKQPKIQISPQIKYVLEELPSEITPADIDSALAEFRTTSMDLTELDALNSQFHSGDSMAIYDILAQLEKISTIPKTKKTKPKGWPVDVSLGYYSNDLELDMGDAEINSINKLLSLQAGKTFNLPFISFLGGIGIYGGIGFESSDLNLRYTLENPIGYGCFSGSGDSKTYFEEIEKEDCIGSTKEWGPGVPTDINLNFPGENKFRTTIGARMRILFVDVFIDYNMGTSNAYNAGFGITFR